MLDFIRFIVPLLVLMAGVGICWGTIVARSKALKAEVDDKVKSLNVRVSVLEGVCMKEKDHERLCELNSIKIVTGIKDELMPEIRELKKSQSDEMVLILKSLRDEIKDMNHRGIA